MGGFPIFRLVRLALRILPAVALLVFLGAAFTLPPAKAPAKTDVQVIDTAGPVEMSKCTPCHRDLNAFNNPNLRFKHQAHFKRGIRCQVCHVIFPHQPSGTVKPTMDLCVTCHRLTHGTQGQLAPGDCNFCHPPEFNLRPASHTPDFTGTGHKTDAGGDRQRCLVCHQGEFCESCHRRAGLSPAPADAYRFYPLWPQPPAESRQIAIGATPVEMAKCEPCHRDLGRWKNDKLVNFSHSPHFKRQIRCSQCHDEWPHRVGQIVKPKMAACARCHRLAHGNQGLAAPGECQLCHPATMALRPDFHTNEFISGAHKFWAKQDRGLCRMCHRQEFCDNCHRTEIPHPPGWRSEHGAVANSPDALNDQGQLICLRCHVPPAGSAFGTPSCSKCHRPKGIPADQQVPNVFPHQRPWAPQHGKTAEAVGRETCFTCHKESLCQSCHGSSVQMPHPADWLGQHRTFLRDNPVEQCLNCHQRAQCEQCHSSHKVHNQHTDFNFDSLKGWLQ